ncbi:hypothetical protein AMC99_01826 [Altererythrobacter epoxidivorans]|uniref:Uncharacterized protein n=1 Tax=Altererythrobacter epoxidivorans TaxID=361183 RepID=A0A0M4M8S8_9SPHN|nr:hypothetical protein AMC99_01826 [Altererythrobacter epoxidivorans]
MGTASAICWSANSPAERIRLLVSSSKRMRFGQVCVGGPIVWAMVLGMVERFSLGRDA